MLYPRGMGDATYLEVRCERCKTSFAPGTTRCIHCGGPIGRRLLSLDVRRAGQRPPAPASPESAQPDARPDLARIVRIVLIGLAIAAALARALLERG
jgi:ribosomal protein L37E